MINVPALSDKDFKLYKLGLEQSLMYHTRFFFKHRERMRFIVNPHHYVLCRVLEDVYNQNIKRLIINIPPSYGKTELAVINFISWCFARNKECKFIHTSASDTLVQLNSSKIKEQLTSDEYQQFWPMKLRQDSNAKKLWRIRNGGGLYAVPAGGQITGFHAGRSESGFNGAFIIDDPITPGNVHSDAKRMRNNEWINDTIRSRLDNPNVPIILIMQRLHEEDLTGYLLNGGTGEMWHHLCLPVLIESLQMVV